MCNLSKGVEEKGFRKGYREGFQEGYQKGKQEGIQKGIEAIVSVLRELHIAEDIILSKIQEAFSLDKEEAETYLKG